MNVGDVAEVPEVRVASIFMFEICRVNTFIDTHIYTKRKINRRRVLVGALSGRTGTETDVYGFLNMNL
jgi:hypothetical protein